MNRSFLLPSADELKLNRISFPQKILQGIYFLFNADEIVYVGQSQNIDNRIAVHRLSREKVFDAYSYFETDVSQSDLNDIEALNILTHEPLYNTQIPCNSLFISKQTLKRKTGIGLNIINKLISTEKLKPVYFKGFVLLRKSELELLGFL